MTTIFSALAATHLGSQVTRRWRGVLAPSMGLLLVVLAMAAWTTPNFFSRGVVILAPAISVLWRRR